MLRSGWARTLCIIALASTLFVLRNAQSATAPEPGDLRGVGNVTFSITCAPDVQSDFDRGVALLHSFFYEEARRVFTSVAERDPKCAMAQWGIAMNGGIQFGRRLLLTKGEQAKLPLKKRCR